VRPGSITVEGSWLFQRVRENRLNLILPVRLYEPIDDRRILKQIGKLRNVNAALADGPAASRTMF
jgi:hypothetical protein